MMASPEQLVDLDEFIAEQRANVPGWSETFDRIEAQATRCYLGKCAPTEAHHWACEHQPVDGAGASVLHHSE